MGINKRIVDLTIKNENDYTVILRQNFGEQGQKLGGCLFWVFSDKKSDIFIYGEYQKDLKIFCNNLIFSYINDIDEYKLLLEKLNETTQKFIKDINMTNYFNRLNL